MRVLHLAGGPAEVGLGRPASLYVPAEQRFVPLVCSTVRWMGRSLALSRAQLGDLNLVVGEACGVMLRPDQTAGPGKVMGCRCRGVDGALQVSISAHVDRDAAPDVTGFGWQVLSLLVDDLSWGRDDRNGMIRMHVRPGGDGG